MAKTTRCLNLHVLLFIISLLLLFSTISAFANQNSFATLQTQSDKGDREAQNLLGVKYFAGDGVAKNELKAAELFTRAARQGLAKAQFNLAYMYHQGIALSQNYIQACVWYKAAADQGHSEAQASYDLLITFISDEKRDKISKLSAQIPSQAIVDVDRNSSAYSPDEDELKNWLNTVHPAAGR